MLGKSRNTLRVAVYSNKSSWS